MSYSNEDLTEIFDRTDGTCHLCGGCLRFSSYGRHGKRGAWEVEHSNPKAKGGKNRRNNLYAAHISCNRSKGTTSTRAIRAQYGRTAAPFSTAKRAAHRKKNTMIGAVIGGLGSKVLGASDRDAVILAVFGGAIGHKIEPDPQRR